jgi:hypothetical protein
MFLVVWKNAQMHQNTFLTTPDVKLYLFYGHDSGGLEVFKNASKHVFKNARRSKISFLKKVSGGLEVCTFLTTTNVQKYLFLKKSFWWSRCIPKCIKTRF